MTKKKGRPVGQTIGSIIVGFDQQIFRTTPPVQELIAKGQPVRGVSGQVPGALEVIFPEDIVPPEGALPPDGAAPPDDAASPDGVAQADADPDDRAP